MKSPSQWFGFPLTPLQSRLDLGTWNQTFRSWTRVLADMVSCSVAAIEVRLRHTRRVRTVPSIQSKQLLPIPDFLSLSYLSRQRKKNGYSIRTQNVCQVANTPRKRTPEIPLTRRSETTTIANYAASMLSCSRLEGKEDCRGTSIFPIDAALT